MIKGRYNRGLESNLYFWRDHIGNEVDIIVEQASQLLPIEIKSGQTVTKDSFSGLTQWSALADTVAHRPYLCFGGDEAYTRYGISVLPWTQVGSLAQVI